MNDADAAAGIVGLGYEAGHLKRVVRAGWLLAGVGHPESVAEHSFRAGILAYMIAVQEGADADRAAVLGLFHDLPEARTGDVASVGKRYVRTAEAAHVVRDQVAALPSALAERIADIIGEHEAAKTPEGTLEAKCSRDADKLECLLQAREYAAAGNQQVQPWITTMAEAVTTETGKRLAAAAQELPPDVWWERFAESFGQQQLPDM